MNYDGKKAQTSIEFLVSFSLIILLFIILSLFLYQKFIQANEIKIDMAGQKISNSIADAINSVLISGEGFSICMQLPEKISLDKYQVKFYQDEATVFVHTERQTWSSPLSTPYVNCTLNICTFAEKTTTIHVNETINVKISNRNDTIYIEEC